MPARLSWESLELLGTQIPQATHMNSRLQPLAETPIGIDEGARQPGAMCLPGTQVGIQSIAQAVT